MDKPLSDYQYQDNYTSVCCNSEEEALLLQRVISLLGNDKNPENYCVCIYIDNILSFCDHHSTLIRQIMINNHIHNEQI